MGKVTGFLEIARRKPAMRPAAERVRDWREVNLPEPQAALSEQAARCMDCGIPFCHQGCPLGNHVPEWNDLVYRGRHAAANARLHATNNFPEFTGRLCPAPCEGSCVLGINDDPVTIKSVELDIVERAFGEGRVVPPARAADTGCRVAVVGSGPAGLSCADQLHRAGHTVTVFERADRIGGLLRYGIPEFKLEKRVLDRRLAVMKAAGVEFRTGVHVGHTLPAAELQRSFDAIVLAGGATLPRDLPVPGRELEGIHFAMDYLAQQNRRCQEDLVDHCESISATDRHVVIIGGGDTGADCLGTAIRQGARSVRQLELLPRPADTRGPNNPWPEWPNIFRVSSAHEEGGERLYSISTQQFLGDEQGRVRGLQAVQIAMARRDGRTVFDVVPDSEIQLEAELVLLALGFVGPERGGMLADLGVALTERGTVQRDQRWMTSVPGVFTCGDMQRGQSLIVWAIAEGRSAARGVDMYLMGWSELPAPVA
jgi:glutamate synthase (NADPH) small chain